MNRSALRASALGCALLASTCLTAPAVAQSTPSVYQHVDENGVDQVDGLELLEGAEEQPRADQENQREGDVRHP